MARTVQCHGSVRAQMLHPGPAETEETREGEAAHWVKAEITQGVILQVGEVAPNGVAVTQEMLDGGHLALECFQQALGDDWQTLLQTETTLPPGTIHPENWGTPDDWAWVGATDTLWLWDYKFGHGPVEVYRNYQLLNYVDLILQSLQLPRTVNVRAVIIQPRSFHPDGKVREWRFQPNFSFWAKQYDAMREASLAALAPVGVEVGYRVGPECKHCTARAYCATLQTEGLEEVDQSKRGGDSVSTPAEVAMELALLERAANVIESRKSGLEEQALRLIHEGHQLAGYAAGFGQGKTVWTKSDPEMVMIGMLQGLDLAKPPAAITPIQAKQKGLNPTLVDSFTRTTRGEARLVKASAEKASQIFGST
ncbi:MAG: hypothetical protein YHS30scaffold667_61 [Phage 65_10]|nr:MAG: hypothetical protein YHS30scaffold667_61 [Phage 65_10]